MTLCMATIIYIAYVSLCSFCSQSDVTNYCSHFLRSSVLKKLLNALKQQNICVIFAIKK